MKELSPGDIVALSGPVIEPCFLIEIELDEVLYLSTRQRYEYGDIVYESGLVQGLQISQSEVSFGLINEGYQYTTPALNGAYQRAPVRVLWSQGLRNPRIVESGYFADGYYVEDNREPPMLVFQGNVASFGSITTILGVVATRSAARHYPTKRVLPPIANFVRPEGTVISFGDYVFRLEARDS